MLDFIKSLFFKKTDKKGNFEPKLDSTPIVQETKFNKIEEKPIEETKITVQKPIISSQYIDQYNNIPFKKEIKISRTVRHFQDKEQYFEDYGHLTPSQARREMKQRKEEFGEWLSFEEYGGYMNAINAEKDYDFIDKIEKMTPQQAEKWFNKRMEQGHWNSTNVFQAIAEKLKPFHEEYLLTEMDTVTQGRIEGWVNARKKQGYFFSDKAYEKADKILSGEIENRKSKKPKKK